MKGAKIRVKHYSLGGGCGSLDLGGEGVGDSCEIGDADVASDAEGRRRGRGGVQHKSVLLDQKGKPLQANSWSTRCGCNAMIRLLRSGDGGWYVCEHRVSFTKAC